ncbi:MAG: CRISPR-associated helicase Cas3' [Lachnospiraceae bacterium]|nr:CRISPR-associated helicase Cas3' [Lachnospiraceae bacterium]
MDKGIYYAHSTSDGNWEPLIDHLNKTASLAEKYADEFHCARIGRQLGLLHDVGKHTLKFQRVLKHQEHKINHAVVAAELYADVDKTSNREYVDNTFIFLMICNALNGHHSLLQGNFNQLSFFDPDNLYPLPDDYNNPGDLQTNDDNKQNALSSSKEYQEILNFVRENGLMLSIESHDYPDVEIMDNATKMLFSRMMFSCLIDADYTATASFENEQPPEISDDRVIKAKEMLDELEAYRNAIISDSDTNNRINELRNEVYLDATLSGAGKTGFYTLTAPTGTAKTLALMKFALEQVAANAQERIIVVLPYLSIITQNADVYRKIFGDDVVLEDDSQTEYSDDARIYADRWDAPIIVTTSVKFFETLFSSKAPTLRKLHRIANAVIVFDESQTLPSFVTDVSIKTLKALPDLFNTTVLLSTATQPSYNYRQELCNYEHNEIISDPKVLYDKYRIAKQTKTVFDTDKLWSYEDLVDYFGDRKQVIYVLNTTGKADKMYHALKDRHEEDSVFLLSSRLCVGHKMKVIKEVKRRLEENLPCYLSSTQCIEAGVDVDFPSGAREYAPFTSIVQTAGRINRNGCKSGKMLVFRSEDNGRFDYPTTDYLNEAAISLNMAEINNSIDTNNLSDIESYYKKLYSGNAAEGHDSEEIRKAEEECDIKEMSEKYQLIDGEKQYTVIVPYNEFLTEYSDFRDKVEKNQYCFCKKDMRKLRDFSVNIYSNGKGGEFIRNHCHRLSLFSPFGISETNWFIADIDDIYNDKTGLQVKEKTGGVLIG